MSTSAQIPVNVIVPGSTRAPIVADFVEHAIRAAYINRRDTAALPDADWGVPGVYILLTSDGSGKIYVGKATNLRNRLMEHNRRPKLKWTRAITFKRDTSHGFNSSEIGYLEGRLAAELRAIPDVQMIEGKQDTDTTLPAHMLLSLDSFLQSMLAAVRLSGVDIFKDADRSEAEEEKESRKKAGVKRSYTRHEGTVQDLLNSGLLQAGTHLFLSQGGKDAQGAVTTTGEIIVDGVAYASPSRAAATALGLQSSNGWEAWHVGSLNGQCLAQLRA